MTQRPVMLIAALLGVCGWDDSGRLPRDFATCKLKMLENYKPRSASDAAVQNYEGMRYLQTCMKAAGYRLNQTLRDEQGTAFCNYVISAEHQDCYER
jgi:hypothetical protein